MAGNGGAQNGWDSVYFGSDLRRVGFQTPSNRATNKVITAAPVTAMGQLNVFPANANGSALRKWIAGATCNMLIIRPLSSGGALSCTKVFAMGQNNPVLATPTKKKMVQEGQYQVDQANKAKNIQTAIKEPTNIRDLRL